MNSLEEQLQSSQRDVGLILDDVKRNDLKAAIHGMETVIRDLTELLDASRQAVAAHQRIARTLRSRP